MKPRSLAATLTALLAALIAAVPAQGDITATTIVSPPDGFTTQLTGTDQVGPLLTVSGTSDGTAGDEVLVTCYFRLDGSDRAVHTLGTAAVDDAGAWSLTVGTADHPFPNGGGCTLHALPATLAPFPTTEAGLASYPGPRIVVEWQKLSTDGGVLDDFYLARVGSAGYADFLTLNSCALCDMALYDPATFTRSHFLFESNGAAYVQERGLFGDDRSHLQVDGHNTRGALDANKLAPLGGGPPTVITFGEDPVVTETEPIVRCTNDSPFPPMNRDECGRFVDTGVGFTGTMRILNGGRTVVLRHTWSAIDGTTHAVDLHYDEFQKSPNSPPPQYRLPWISSDFVSPYGASFPGPSTDAPVSIFVRSTSAVPQGSFDDPVGAMTFAPPPALIRFANTSATEFIAAYRFQVAPGAPIVITQRFDLSDAFGDLQETAATARDDLTPPTIVIVSPADGATTSSPVHVTGTAADRDLASVTVDGSDVGVMPHGTWATDLARPGGPNTIAAVAADAAGNTATATRAITVVADTIAPELTVGDVASKVKRKTLLRSGIGIDVTCNEACSVVGQLVRSAKRHAGQHRVVAETVLATSSLGLGTGSRTLTLKPTGKAARKIHRGNALTLNLTAADAASNTRAETTTIHVR